MLAYYDNLLLNISLFIPGHSLSKYFIIHPRPLSMQTSIIYPHLDLASFVGRKQKARTKTSEM